MYYIKNFKRIKKNVIGLQPYNHLCKEMIHRAFEVVTGGKKGTYNPVTTAYNRQGVTTSYNAATCCNSASSAAVVGCKRIWKIFYFFSIFHLKSNGYE